MSGGERDPFSGSWPAASPRPLFLRHPMRRPGEREAAMAHIEKRANNRYRVRYRDPSGRERSRTFDRFNKARLFKATVEDELGRGLWVDPRAGKTTLRDFASLMAPRLNLRPSTRERLAGFLQSQILPAFGSFPLNKIDRLSVQMWLNELTRTLAPAHGERFLSDSRRNPSRGGAPRSDSPISLLPHLTAQTVPLRATLSQRHRGRTPGRSHRSPLSHSHLRGRLPRPSLERARRH